MNVMEKLTFRLLPFKRRSMQFVALQYAAKRKRTYLVPSMTVSVVNDMISNDDFETFVNCSLLGVNILSG